MALKKKFIDVQMIALDSSMAVLGTPETLNKKTIKLDLSRKLRGKGMEAVFKIYAKDGKLIGFPAKLVLMKSFIRRMMRKRIDYVEDSFKTDCIEGKITLKPFLITRKRVSRAVRNNLRRTTKDFLVEYSKDKSYATIAEELLSSELQRQMLPRLKKVYPLSFCDIRLFEAVEPDKIFEKTDIKSILEKPKIKEEAEEAQDEQIEEEKNEEVKEEISEEKEDD